MIAGVLTLGSWDGAGKIAAIPRHIPFVKDKPLLLGKLRVRLSTMAPGRPYTVQLPMLAGRRNGGKRTCTAHLTLQVCPRPLCATFV